MKLEERLEPILRQDTRTKDDDLRLYCVLAHSTTGVNPQKLYDFLSQMPDPESVRRRRQRLQEKDPSLRGLTYAKRHSRSEEMRREYAKSFEEKVENLGYANHTQ